MSSSVHVDNKGKYNLILGSGSTQGLGEHSLTAEKIYWINFTLTKKKSFCFSLHYNGANSYLFVNGIEIYKFKAKDSKIVAAPVCLGNISKDWSVDYMKSTGYNGYVYDFSVDYDSIAVDDILDIRKYLMKKINNISFLTVWSCVNPLSATLLSCISMNNQECKVRPEIVNVNSNEPVFYPFSIKTSKCSGSCNNINDPYAKICVPDVVKDLNVKVFNLMSRTNETRHIKWHETCKCACRLDVSVSNNKQHWNDDKCWCKCKELIGKGVCDRGYIWNPSICECQCDKSCDAGEYLD